MELSEIARVMGITQGAAKVHLFRATHGVRATLRMSDCQGARPHCSLIVVDIRHQQI